MTDAGDRQDEPEQRPTTRRNPLQTASDAVVSPSLARTNPAASVAVAVGLIGLFFPSFGVLPGLGVVVAVIGIVRSRRLAREGAEATGLGRAGVGLALAAAGLLRLVPAVAQLTG
ncbi:hypothetical protein [Amnibacterium endophyticum]|uniref:DUF4190 domain-containing protein n=1 Tax=Amnibacterium endophyticum TaxID=2109337 RepID=A0ABW4LEY7_9MICO